MGKKKANKKTVENPSKGNKAVPVKPIAVDSDEESSEEEVPVKLQQKGKTHHLKASKNRSGYESSEDESKVASQLKKGVKRPFDNADQDSTSDDDDDEEVEEAPVKKNVVATKRPVQQLSAKTQGKKAITVESSSEEDDSDEEEAPQPVKQTSPQKKQPAQQQASKAKGKTTTAEEISSDEEDDSEEEEKSEDEEEEEKKPNKLLSQQKTQPVQKQQKPLSATDSSDSSEESSSEVSSSEGKVVKEAAKTAIHSLKPGQKHVAKKQVQVEDSDEEDDSSDFEDEEYFVPIKIALDDEDSDSDDDDEDEGKEGKTAVKVPERKKRKIEKAGEGPSSKKQKVEGGAKSVNKVKAVKNKRSIDDEDNDEEGDEEKTVKVPESKKRKKEKAKKEATSKKQKLEAVNGDEGTVTLFVGNLRKDTTEDEVSSFFSENNISVKEVRKMPRRSNAFVDLEDADELEDALALTGSTIKSNTVTIEKAKPRSKTQTKDDKKNPLNSSQGSKGENEKDNRTLFVKNLPEDATPKNLSTIFDTALDIRVPLKDGVHKGYGFIEFPDAETMETAKLEKQGVEFKGSSLVLDYVGARSSLKKKQAGPSGKSGRGDVAGKDKKQGSTGSRGESRVLFVKNLSYNTDESSLKAAFKDAVAVRIPTFPDSGKSKGFAFVDFKTAEAAAKGFDSMTGKSIDGRQVTLDFAKQKGALGSGGGRSGFSPRGPGGKGGFNRGGGGGGRGEFNKGEGGMGQSQSKKITFDNDSD